MIRKTKLSVLTGLILWGVMPQLAQAAHVPGRLLVKFRDGVSEAQGRAAVASQGAQSIRTLDGLGVHVVSLPGNANENAVLNVFKQRGDVEFAEFDEIVAPNDVTPDDPYFGSQWHLPRIAAPAAWSTTTGQTGIIIAIVDTGVDGTHPDLSSKMVAGWNIYDNNADSSDIYGHGTMVAGTAAAASNNGQGVAGVCWNCWIMPIRISDANGNATFSAAASGITWAYNHGARVANLSYMMTTSSTVTSAASHMSSKGGAVTMSAGNYSTFDSTADNPSILTVSATDPNDVLYSWSNTGNNVDLAAPGCVYTTMRGGGYGAPCGTSFSAPIVAGVAGLVLSASPNLTGPQLTSRLQQNADDLGTPGFDPVFGWGRVNAARAVNAGGGGTADTQAPTVSITAPGSSSSVASTVMIQAAATDNVGVASVTFYVDGVQLGTSTTAPYSVPWNTTSAANGGHTIAAAARDAAGNVSNFSQPVTVNNPAVPPPTADTTAPVISILSPSAGATVNGTVSVVVSASDNVGVVKVELYVDGVLSTTTTSAPFTTKWNSNPKPVAKGAHTLQVRAYDAAGNIGNSAPVTVYK